MLHTGPLRGSGEGGTVASGYSCCCSHEMQNHFWRQRLMGEMTASGRCWPTPRLPAASCGQNLWSSFSTIRKNKVRVGKAPWHCCVLIVKTSSTRPERNDQKEIERKKNSIKFCQRRPFWIRVWDRLFVPLDVQTATSHSFCLLMAVSWLPFVSFNAVDGLVGRVTVFIPYSSHWPFDGIYRSKMRLLVWR